MAYPADYKYTKEHEWLKIDGKHRRHRHYGLRAELARRHRLR